MRFVQYGKTFDFSSGGESSGQPRHLCHWIRTSTHWHLWLLHLHQASTNHGHSIREVRRKTLTEFFLRWRDLAVQYPGFRTSPTFASVWILLKPKSPFNTLRLQMRPNEAKHFVCTRATDGTRTTSATNLAFSPTCILDHQSRWSIACKVEGRVGLFRNEMPDQEPICLIPNFIICKHC